MKPLLRFAVVGLAAMVVYEVVKRGRTMPLPDGAPFEPAVHSQSQTPSAAGDDLTSISGIGPVYDERLQQAGVHTVSDLASADVEDLAESLDISETLIIGWQSQARELLD